jgi:dihydroxyacetone kinase DhaKLM complex PTS-EIIA-like component DhaM
MPPEWCLELIERILRVDISDGIVASDFERLYNAILDHVDAVQGVLIDLGSAVLSSTADLLLDAMVGNLRAREVPITILRRGPAPSASG